MPPASDTGRPRPLPVLVRAFAHRNYRLYFFGQFVSVTGTWMQAIAQAWLVYRLTGSAVQLGLVSFAGQIPVFLLSPIGGAVADRYSRHRAVITTQTSAMLLALILAGLTLGGIVRVWEIFVLAALLGVVNAFDIPARQAFLVEMVGREDLMNAIALNSSLVNAARVVGPAVAGLLVAAIGEGWCFFVNGISYVAVLGCLLAMRLPPRAAPGRGHSATRAIIEGFGFVWRTGPIRALLVLLGIVSLTALPYSVLMPVFADRVLHGGADTLGLLMGASGFGALIGALSLAARRGVRGLGRWVAVASLAFGLLLGLFAVSRTLWLAMVLMVPIGAAMMIEMSASNTLIQAMVPDALRGRVMAVYSMMFMGMAPFGSLVAGVIAERFGSPWALAAGGLGCAVSAGVFWLRLPAHRVEARQLIVAQEMMGGLPAAGVTGQGGDADA
ncbi:MAG TPA: MFS transporter [Vicinamibacterales bacterium]|nr:MFS transporter [Vicinamibacterales bacterium]